MNYWVRIGTREQFHRLAKRVGLELKFCRDILSTRVHALQRKQRSGNAAPPDPHLHFFNDGARFHTVTELFSSTSSFETFRTQATVNEPALHHGCRSEAEQFVSTASCAEILPSSRGSSSRGPRFSRLLPQTVCTSKHHEAHVRIIILVSSKYPPRQRFRFLRTSR